MKKLHKKKKRSRNNRVKRFDSVCVTGGKKEGKDDGHVMKTYVSERMCVVRRVRLPPRVTALFSRSTAHAVCTGTSKFLSFSALIRTITIIIYYYALRITYYYSRPGGGRIVFSLFFFFFLYFSRRRIYVFPFPSLSLCLSLALSIHFAFFFSSRP